MAIDESTFLVTNEYKGRRYGFALKDYEGKKSLAAVEEGKDGKLYPRWCYPQIGIKDDRKPSDKCIPMQMSLGDDIGQAADMLRVIANVLDGGIEPGDIKDEVPF